MTEVIEVRTPEASFDLFVPENAPAMYVDGVANAAVGFPISRLFFHTIVPPGIARRAEGAAELEQRKVVLEMSIPTAALVEMCMNVLRSTVEGREPLKSGAQTVTTAFSALLDNIAKQSAK